MRVEDHHLEGKIEFNTVNPSLSTGKEYLPRFDGTGIQYH